ncbi:hypothetical protein M3204_05825 [Mesobacillus subterraneus]|nr:hypothetical protein [Mesobacillus subterraneus]
MGIEKPQGTILPAAMDVLVKKQLKQSSPIRSNAFCNMKFVGYSNIQS